MTAQQITDAHRLCPEAMAELARVTRERNALLAAAQRFRAAYLSGLDRINALLNLEAAIAAVSPPPTDPPTEYQP